MAHQQLAIASLTPIRKAIATDQWLKCRLSQDPKIQNLKPKIGASNTMSDEPRLEEQALSKVAEAQISNQMSEAKEIEVDIHTDLLKIAQGQADSVSVVGKDLVTQQDLHMQELELHTDKVSINPLSVLLGKIELNQPLNSTARVVVTESDINQNLNSSYILSRLGPLELNVEGETVPLELKPPMELRLPGNSKMIFRGNMQVPEQGQVQQVRFTGAMYLRPPENSILLESFTFEEGQAISFDVVVALMEKLKELMKLPYLEFDGIAFRIQEIEVQQGKMSLEIALHMNQIPEL